MVINFYTNNVSIKIPERKRLRQFLFSLFEKEGKVFSSVTYIFCNDSFLLSINQEFLGHDDYTDVISFSLNKPGDPIIGEIYISVDMVRFNARLLKVNVVSELQRVIIHGSLHLCGYRDKTLAEKNVMTLSEDRYLQTYFL